jgi:hypothetical protein
MTLEPRPAARVMDVVIEDTAVILSDAPEGPLKILSKNSYCPNQLRNTEQVKWA